MRQHLRRHAQVLLGVTSATDAADGMAERDGRSDAVLEGLVKASHST